VGAHGAAGSSRRDTGGEPVVDDDDRPSGQLGQAAVAAVLTDASCELVPLPTLDRGDRLLVEARHRGTLLVHHTDAALGDGPDAELRLLRSPELADPYHVHGCPECPRDLRGDRYPPAWQREHDDILPGVPLQQSLRGAGRRRPDP
jgi:hypothetical protein